MEVKLFTNRSFVGSYKLYDLIGSREIIGTGSIIEADNQKYLVHTVRLRKNDEAVIEVSSIR